MRNLSIRRLLLLKRVRSVVSAPTLSDLDSLGHRLRRDFPEYQRQPKKEFFKVLKALLSEECQITVVSSDSLVRKTIIFGTSNETRLKTKIPMEILQQKMKKTARLMMPLQILWFLKERKR